MKSLLKWLKYNGNAANIGGIANRARIERAKFFECFFSQTFSKQLTSNERIRILDVGGEFRYWQIIEFKYISNVEIDLANLRPEILPDNASHFSSISADATNLSSILDKTYDLVFSNSCIEHVGKKREWKMMAEEVRRVGKHMFLQTPNMFFPIEPHFMFPFFQFLPLKMRAFLINHYQLGFWPKGKNWEESLKIADEIHLLNYRNLKELFPEANIKRERLLGLTKSFMVYR